jgi:hypothetical protein
MFFWVLRFPIPQLCRIAVPRVEVHDAFGHNRGRIFCFEF